MLTADSNPTSNLKMGNIATIPLLFFLRKSVAIPLQIPCKSHFSPIHRNGLTTDLERTCSSKFASSKKKIG